MRSPGRPDLVYDRPHTSDPMTITGLSMAAHAQAVNDPAEVVKALGMLPAKYPEYASFPMPSPDQIRVFRVTPTVISVLDYSKGFGHFDVNFRSTPYPGSANANA